MSVPTRLSGSSRGAAPNPSLAVTAASGPAGAGGLLSAWLAELDSAALRRHLGPAALAELDDLTRETDPEILSQSWFNFAYRQQQAGRLEWAALAFRALAASGLKDAARARRQWEAMQGQGAAGRRWEFLLGQFAEQAADPAMLGGMMLASTVFQGVRFAGLSRLLANPEGSWLTRGVGARWAAASLGFAAEVPTFLVASKGIHQALGHSQDWSAAALSREGLGLGVNLLFLKGFAALGRGGLEAAHGSVPGNAASPWLRAPSVLLPQASALAGIYLGHRAESWLGLRPRLDDATTLSDSLAMLLQFHVGGRLSSALLGPRIAQGIQTLEIASRTMGPGPRAQGAGLAAGVPDSALGLRPAFAVADSAHSVGLPPPQWKNFTFDPMRMNSLGEGESSPYRFLERKLRAKWLESLEPGPEAEAEHRDRFLGKVDELAENYLRTPGIDLQRYYGLLNESRLQDVHHDDGRVTTRLEQLSVAAKYFRHAMEMNTFRRAVGSLYDHLMQEAFERTLTEGTVADFDALIKVASVHRRIESVENFLRDRGWEARYALREPDKSQPPPPPPSLLDRLRTKLRLPAAAPKVPPPVWAARLQQQPLSAEAKAIVARYFHSFGNAEAAGPFRDGSHNFILWKPSHGEERREPFTVSVALDGLQTYLKTWKNHRSQQQVLEDAIRRATENPTPLLHLDRIFKLLATRDLPHKLAEVASREEFNWGQLEGILELSSDEPGWASSAAKLNGTIYTGYIYDAILAEKFCRFYQGAGVYLHQVEMQIRLGRFHYRAKELLEDKVTEGLEQWMSERNRKNGKPPPRPEVQEKRTDLERSVNYDREDILHMLKLNPTFVGKQAIETIENGQVELQLLSKQAVRDLWRRLPHDEKEKDPPAALYVPADKSPTKKPLIVVTELDKDLTRDQKIVRAITLPALVVHEFEHYLHRNELSNVMVSEMRAWLEEYYFLMHHGQSNLWYEMQETTPYGFGVYLRNLVDKDYLEGPRDVPLRLKR